MIEDITSGEVLGESLYNPLSEEELKELAVGCLRGQVFGSWMIPEHSQNLTLSIFMIVGFLDDIQIKELQRDGVVHFYEWLDKANNVSINGYPTFLSARFLDVSDFNRLVDKVNKVKEALDAI